MTKALKTKAVTENFVKNEVEKLRIRMDSKFSDVQETLDKHKDQFVKVNDKLDLVLNQLDSIAGQFKKFDEERELMSDKIREHSDQIEDIQKIVYAN